MFLTVALAIAIFAGQMWHKIASFEITNWTQDFKGDCALVFTGGAGRIREGIDLLARANVKKLIISGVNPQANFSEIFQELPFYSTVNTEDVVLEKRSTTTYGNVQQSIPLLEALNCKEVVLVTSRLHMYRAMRVLKASLPKEMHMQTDAIYTGESPDSFLEISEEVLKSLFYQMWAF